MRPVLLIVCLASISLLANAPTVAAIEKWVDDDGRIHYGDWPPPGVDAEPLRVWHNVIDTGVIDTGVIDNSVINRPTPMKARPAPSKTMEYSAPALRPEMQSYVEQCREQRGIDCETEARQMIDGPATVIFPGDPLVFPRPDVKPPPPGLPLKYSITPVKRVKAPAPRHHPELLR